MHRFKVVEIFESINGEGTRAGQPAVFVRFQGCNLSCSYCDTAWANTVDAEFTWMTEMEIYDRIKRTGIKNVTLTGGEPLLREGIGSLLEILTADEGLSVEIETNGSVFLKDFAKLKKRPIFTMDYKLPGSGMENKMCVDNFSLLAPQDTVKFVAGRNDLGRIKEIVEKYPLIGKCHIYISPVFGQIEPAEIVEFLLENRYNDVNLQLQLHKIIWDPDRRGV